MAITGRWRTDLASEAQRLAQNGRRDLSPLPGVETAEEERAGCSLFRVRITDERGARALGKPVGRYCTLEAGRFLPRGDPGFPVSLESQAAEPCEFRLCLLEKRGIIAVPRDPERIGIAEPQLPCNRKTDRLWSIGQCFKIDFFSAHEKPFIKQSAVPVQDAESSGAADS